MRRVAFLTGLSVWLSLAGCPDEIDIDIDDVSSRLGGAVGVIQTRPQALPQVLIDQGDTIIIDNSVTIIDDPNDDIIIDRLPDRTILGFENDTGFDIYVQYFVEDELQAVFVFDGEALLLEYPCIGSVDLVSEDDIDVATGILVQSFDLTGNVFFNPDDFICGDALILTFDPFAVTARAEVIDLLH